MEDVGWMRHALGLARRGLGRVWPNPAVGCVLVRDGRLIGEGWTQTGGRPHAETEALAMAGDARGATAYVTLEPCAHQGQTGPCAAALVSAGIARCEIALSDPDPRVSGRGIEMLRAGGVAVSVGLGADEATRVNAGFLSRIATGRPAVTLKLASTIDGRIATASGESRWITGPEARLYVHHLRATHDAVMIGAGTARADDPMLDVRGLGTGVRQPVRIVVDGSLSLPLTGQLARTAAAQPLWLIHGGGVDPARRRAWRDLGAVCVRAPQSPGGRLDLAQALVALGHEGLTRVLCEGGGQMAAELIRAGLAQELQVITAGSVIGAEGVPNVAGLALAALADAPVFRQAETRPLGADILTRWVSARGGQNP